MLKLEKFLLNENVMFDVTDYDDPSTANLGNIIQANNSNGRDVEPEKPHPVVDPVDTPLVEPEKPQDVQPEPPKEPEKPAEPVEPVGPGKPSRDNNVVVDYDDPNNADKTKKISSNDSKGVDPKEPEKPVEPVKPVVPETKKEPEPEVKVEPKEPKLNQAAVTPAPQPVTAPTKPLEVPKNLPKIPDTGKSKGAKKALPFIIGAIAIGALIFLLTKLFKKKPKEKVVTPNTKEKNETTEVKKEPVKKEPEKKELLDGFSSSFTYANNSEKMSPEERKQAEKQAKNLVATLKKKGGEFPPLTIVGSASNNGPDKRNEELGKIRADELKEIYRKAGYTGEINAVGIGAKASKLNGKDYEAAKNDRASIVMTGAIPADTIKEFKESFEKDGGELNRITSATNGVLKIGDVANNKEAYDKVIEAAKHDPKLSSVLISQAETTNKVNGKESEGKLANEELLKTGGKDLSQQVIEDVNKDKEQNSEKAKTQDKEKTDLVKLMKSKEENKEVTKDTKDVSKDNKDTAKDNKEKETTKKGADISAELKQKQQEKEKNKEKKNQKKKETGRS